MIIKSSGNFKPAPEGLHDAVIVDQFDLGLVETPWGKKPQLRTFWEINVLMENGKRFIVMKTYGVSLHKKAILRKDLQGILGRPLTEEELRGFEIESTIGMPCQVLIVHNTGSDGMVYANVQTVMKAGANRLSPSGNFIRHKDRKDGVKSEADDISY
jgi:hypothetical protein